LVQKRGEGEKKKRGEGVWHWEGMSESEEEDWRSSSEAEDGEEDAGSYAVYKPMKPTPDILLNLPYAT
jgi:hypothetical protein